jgi:hypothetical protein
MGAYLPDKYDDIVPEGANPLWGWRMVTFLDSDGAVRRRWVSDGEPLDYEVVAGLEIAKTTLIIEEIQPNTDDFDRGQ